MNHTPWVRSFDASEWPTYKALRLRALADAPDAFGGTLAAEQGRVDEEWQARLARGTSSRTDLPLVATTDQQAVGLAWARVDDADPTVAHLYQLWVAPEFRSQGAGRLLLAAAIDWAARLANVRTMVLGVTCGDTPATRLYARARFRAVGEPEPIRPGSTLLGQTMRLELDSAAGAFSSV